MKQLLFTIDKLLRGEFTRPEDLRQGKVRLDIKTLIKIGVFLGIVYGVFMGLYGVCRPNPSFLQLIASMVKTPLLYLLTLTITYPSLYVFSTLAGSKLKFFETLRLLLIGIAINLTLLASFGAVTGFFTLSTDSYHFMVILNVIFFAAGGAAGLVVMYRSLRAMARDENVEKDLNQRTRTKAIFNTWVIIYGAVGAQMGWILRPFIGAPNAPFEFFRSHKESNFFASFFQTLYNLFG